MGVRGFSWYRSYMRIVKIGRGWRKKRKLNEAFGRRSVRSFPQGSVEGLRTLS